MAVSSCIGSNIFDILFCLGVPWLIDLAFVRVNSTVTIVDDMTYVSVCLISSAVIVFTALLINNWRLNKVLGGLFIIGYIIFILISVVTDNMSTLPKC